MSRLADEVGNLRYLTIGWKKNIYPKREMKKNSLRQKEEEGEEEDEEEEENVFSTVHSPSTLINHVS